MQRRFRLRAAFAPPMMLALAVAASCSPSSGTHADGAEGGAPSGDDGSTLDADASVAVEGGHDAGSVTDGSSPTDGSSSDAGDAGAPADAAADVSTSDAGAEAGTVVPAVSLCTAPPPRDAACPSFGVGHIKCGAVCTNVVSDETNCGACGHACGAGDICADAMCVTQASLALPAVVSTPSAFDLTNAYVVNRGVWRIDKTTFAALQLTTASNSNVVAVDAAFVYGVYGSDVFRVPISGGAPWETWVVGAGYPRILHVDDHLVYARGGMSIIHRDKVGANAPSTRAAVLVSSVSSVDATHYYYRRIDGGGPDATIIAEDKVSGASKLVASNPHGLGEPVAPGPTYVMKQPRASGPYLWNIRDASTGRMLAAGTTTRIDGADAGYPRLASDGCNRFYAFDGEIVRIEPSTPAFVVAKPGGTIDWIGADDRWVYWRDATSVRIHRVPKFTTP